MNALDLAPDDYHGPSALREIINNHILGNDSRYAPTKSINVSLGTLGLSDVYVRHFHAKVLSVMTTFDPPPPPLHVSKWLQTEIKQKISSRALSKT